MGMAPVAVTVSKGTSRREGSTRGTFTKIVSVKRLVVMATPLKGRGASFSLAHTSVSPGALESILPAVWTAIASIEPPFEVAEARNDE